MKRLRDLGLSMLAMLALAPVLVIVALAVLAHDGRPVLFRQLRVGRHAAPFGMLKFRSMIKDAASQGPYFTNAGDSRITPVGRFIRRTSLDELPQLFNVLRGDMSLVGPRPDVPAQRSLYTDAQWVERHSVRPGITGWAQAKLRSEGSDADRLALDLRFIRERSLWLDIQIMLWTLGRLSGKGSN